LIRSKSNALRLTLQAIATNLDPTPIDPQTRRLKLLWDSQRAGVAYTHSKFCAPVVADGKLLVPTYDGRIDMYTL